MAEPRMHYLNGRWRDGRGAEHVVESSRTGEPMTKYLLASAADVDAAVAAARDALAGPWARWTAGQRAAALRALAAQLEPQVGGIAALAAEEVGTPVTTGSMVQARGPVFSLGYYADQADGFPFTELRDSAAGSSAVLREPVGVVAAIVPWNLPLALAAQKAAPALAAGCTVVVKAPPEAPLTGRLLAEAAEVAGLPPGVFNYVVADAAASRRLVSHPGVDKVSFTGSTAVGRQIGAACGADIRRMTLELGGKSAAILLDDVDLGAAAPQVARYIVGANSGQGCVCQTRVLVPRSREEEATAAIAAAFRELRFGDPLDDATVIGPMATRGHAARVAGYIDLGLAEGAEVVVGGGTAAGDPRGFYVPPTLFSGVSSSMRIAREEVFGPVGVVISYRDPDEAVAVANDSDFGLTGTVWTADAVRGFEVARRVRVGVFGVNTFWVDRNAPFGGMKASGLGREMGVEGLVAYTEAKSVSLPPGSALRPALAAFSQRR